MLYIYQLERHLMTTDKEDSRYECYPFLALGYSIFVIRGNLPECEADQLLQIMRVEQQHRPKLIGEEEAQTSGQR